jgi:hypothetical protein
MTAQHVAAGDGALKTSSWLARPLTPARVGPSQDAHPHPYKDPSNYLG